jgi:hypothetical protein
MGLPAIRAEGLVREDEKNLTKTTG